MGRYSSCRTLNPPHVCAALVSFLEYTRDGQASKSTCQIYSTKDLLISNIVTISKGGFSLVDTFLRITNPTMVIKKGLEGSLKTIVFSATKINFEKLLGGGGARG